MNVPFFLGLCVPLQHKSQSVKRNSPLGCAIFSLPESLFLRKTNVFYVQHRNSILLFNLKQSSISQQCRKDSTCHVASCFHRVVPAEWTGFCKCRNQETSDSHPTAGVQYTSNGHGEPGAYVTIINITGILERS